MLNFVLGCFVGGIVGVGVMCLCVISGQESRMEEQDGTDSV